jgi:ribosomal protein S18 acetylase RimI-like enzyme
MRGGREEDHRAYLRLFPELRTGDEPLSKALWAIACERERVVVVDIGGEAAAYALFDRLRTTVYLRNIAVAPGLRRRGAARALIGKIAFEQRRRGATHWALNVEPSNTAASELYASIGLERTYESAAVRFPWARVPARGDTPVQSFGRREAAELEDAFDLDPGQLEVALERPGVVPLVARGPNGEPVGISVFAPDFPGALPFRADEEDVAWSLLCHMRERRAPSTPWVQLLVEAAPWLERLLLQSGGKLHMRTVRWTGPIGQ